eukprot:1133644-Pelagomonas_calceolata.AAC.5
MSPNPVIANLFGQEILFGQEHHQWAQFMRRGTVATLLCHKHKLSRHSECIDEPTALYLYHATVQACSRHPTWPHLNRLLFCANIFLIPSSRRLAPPHYLGV